MTNPNSTEAEFQVWMEDDTFCADTMGPRDRALSEARNYAMQYAQDGPVRIEEITRTVVERIAQHAVAVANAREAA